MNSKFSHYMGVIAASVLAAAVLSACGGSDDEGSQAPATPPKGTIQLAAFIDAPSCAFDTVNLTVSKLRFHTDRNADPSASGWAELSFSPARKLGLLNQAGVLNGPTTALGELSLPVGLYTQMRVVFDANTGGTANTARLAGTTAEMPLQTPSELASAGWRTPVDIWVQEGAAANAVLDFDVCNSILPNGGTYQYRPRVRQLPTVQGSVRGFVDPALLGARFVITAQQLGGIQMTAVPHPTTGEFILPMLNPGLYEVVAHANGRATAVIGTVPVVASTTTQVTTAAAPLSPAASATSSISGRITYTPPAVAPSSGTWVTAVQSLNSNINNSGNGVTLITHRFQPVEQSTGDYLLANLPRAAVQYTKYSPTNMLPLVNAGTNPGAGNYRVEAVASGFSIKVTTANAGGALRSDVVNVANGNAANVNIPLP